MILGDDECCVRLGRTRMANDIGEAFFIEEEEVNAFARSQSA